MPRFECMRAQHRRPMLFLDQLLAGAAGKVGQNEIGEPLAGRQLDQELPVLSAGTMKVAPPALLPLTCRASGQPVRQHGVALRPFLGDDRLGHGTRTRRVAARSRLHERNQEVAPCHVRSRLFDKFPQQGLAARQDESVYRRLTSSRRSQRMCQVPQVIVDALSAVLVE